MNWDFINTIDDINIISETFTNRFMEAAHLTISNKQCVIRTKDKPWMNNEIRKQIRKSRRIHKTAKRVNTTEQWKKFRLQRNKVTSLIRKCKQDYYSRVADNLNSDHRKSTKSWWNLCKYLYTGKTNQNVIGRASLAQLFKSKVRLKVLPEQLTLFVNTSVTFKKGIIQ